MVLLRILCAFLDAFALEARMISFIDEKVESPAVAGQPFGDSGEYERMTGRALGEIDPPYHLLKPIAAPWAPTLALPALRHRAQGRKARQARQQIQRLDTQSLLG